jgi:hypothetical protein
MNRLFGTLLLVVCVATSALAQRGFHELGSQDPERTEATSEPAYRLARPFVAMLDAHAGWGLAGGDLYEGSENGFVYGGGARVGLSPRSYLSFRIRSQRIFSEEETYPAYEDYPGGTIEATLDVRQYLLCFGQLLSPSDGRSLGGYFELGLGLGDNVGKVSLGSQSITQSETFTMLAIQAGGLIPLDDGGLVLDLSFSMLAKLLKENSRDDIFNAFLFSGQVGLGYRFQSPGS